MGSKIRGDLRKMEVEIFMPRLGQEMTKGTIVEWYKKEGDRLEKEEPLFLVDTDKATIDVESEVAGVLKKILAGENQEVPVGQVVAVIEAEG
jgi:pyruvate/2-oxoglutarate dehydrogenase complex dihydrolipoamide acyltransferase (E2) component